MQQPISIAPSMGSHKKWDFIPRDTHKCAYVDHSGCSQGKRQVMRVILAFTIAWVLLNSKGVQFCLGSKQSGSLTLHYFFFNEKKENASFVRSYLMSLVFFYLIHSPAIYPELI